MLQHKLYMNIQRFKEFMAIGFSKGDHIIIQEKIDGSNCSFQYDPTTDKMIGFSRKNTLSCDLKLNGAYSFVNNLDKMTYAHYPQYRFFGEWLVSHSVVYPQEAYQNFYLYDLYNPERGEYELQFKVKEIAETCNLKYVPVFYDGPFISWEHCLSFVGHTMLGGKFGEGIVVKNQTKINNPNSITPFYVKIVGEKFSEVHKNKLQKIINPSVLQEIEYKRELTATIVTQARVEKLLHKMVDDGILPLLWNENDMSTISKNIPRAVYDDCVKEENDTVIEVGEVFGKFAQKIAMEYVRKVLKNK